MHIEKLLVYSATQKTDCRKTTLFRSILKLDFDVDLVFEENNTKSLPIRYNEAIRKAKEEDYDALILVHDDVSLEEIPTSKLEQLFDTYDLVGVAGASTVALESPALWHIMGGGFDGGSLHGCVYHVNENGVGKFPTRFGPYPHQVVMLDGVFLALGKNAINNTTFDETNPCIAHFYDLDYSLSCHKRGLDVGVGNVVITHDSPGLREFTEEWRKGEQWFLNKYGK